jgi:hypothetical protein
MSTHDGTNAADTQVTGFADSPPEVAEHGSSTLATVLPLLISPALAKFATGVEAVIKSQVSFIVSRHAGSPCAFCNNFVHLPIQTVLATELERLNAETLRLDSAPSIPSQVPPSGRSLSGDLHLTFHLD